MTARPIRYQRQVSDRNGKIFYTSITSLSHISKIHTRKTIVSKMADILKAIPTGIIFKIFFLIGNRITLAIQIIIS